MQDQILDTSIHDESSDRKYFTTVPNFIIDHAGAIPVALYLSMKRYAGEVGSCYASERTLCKNLDIGRKALHKAIEFLIDQGWIKFMGPQYIETDGGPQVVKAYAITDVWKKNVNHYAELKGESERSPLVKSIPLSESTLHEAPNGGLRGAPKERKGVRFGATKKNHYIKKNHSNNAAPGAAPEIVEVIDAFKTVNPSFGKWYGNKTQRTSIERMLETHGKERIMKVIALLPQTNRRPYMPTITSPVQLEDKWAALASALVKEKEKITSKSKVAFT